MKKIIFTDKAPAPIGPYNQAVLVGNTLYTSGQIALNPITMELVMDDIEIETKQVMENMKAVLEAADMTFDNVVKTTIFIMNMAILPELILFTRLTLTRKPHQLAKRFKLQVCLKELL